MLIPRYPGLWKLFLCFKELKGATDTQTIMKLWKRTGVLVHHPEWDLFHQFAAICISKGEVATILEDTPLDEIGIVPKEGGGAIEKLLYLIAYGSVLLLKQHRKLIPISSGVYELSGLIAIRYLGGILELPTFWLQENYDYHQSFAGKLFQTTRKCLEDIGIGCNHQLDPTTEKISDSESIDTLAYSLVVGATDWRAWIHDQEPPYWLEALQNLIDLLLRQAFSVTRYVFE